MPKARHREDRRSSVDAQIVQWLSLSDWLRAIQRFRGYVSAGDFGSALRDGIFEHSSDIHTSEDDTDRAHVCVGLACAVAGAERYCQSAENGPLFGKTVIRETCLAQCWRAPVIIPKKRAHPGVPETRVQYEGEPFEEYCKGGGYGVLKSCLTRRRSLDTVVSCLSSSALCSLEKAEVPIGIRIKALRNWDARTKVLMLIDEHLPGDMSQSFFLSQFAHRVLEGLLIVAHALGTSQVVMCHRGRYKELCRGFYEQFLVLRARVLGSNFKLTLINADDQSEQDSLRQTCDPDDSENSNLFALIVDPGFAAWIPEAIASGNSSDAEEQAPPTLFSLVGCVARPGVYKAPILSSIRHLIALAGGIKPSERLDSFVPGAWRSSRTGTALQRPPHRSRNYRANAAQGIPNRLRTKRWSTP